MTSEHTYHIQPTTYTPLPLCSTPHPWPAFWSCCSSQLVSSSGWWALLWSFWDNHSGLHFTNKICSAPSFCFANNLEKEVGGGHSSFWEGRSLILLWVKRCRKGLACSCGLPNMEEDCVCRWQPGPGGRVMKNTSLLSRGPLGQLVLNRCGQAWHTHRCRAECKD